MSTPDPFSIRVGDHEREQAAHVLGEQFAHGRLRDEEYAERLDAAWSARTWADLDVLFHDLPVTPVGESPRPPAPPARPDGVGPGPILIVLAVIGVLAIVTKGPILVLMAGLVAFIVLKQHRRRQRRDAGPPIWR